MAGGAVEVRDGVVWLSVGGLDGDMAMGQSVTPGEGTA